MAVEDKPLLKFTCDKCEKEGVGGDWYLALPEGWASAHLGYGNKKMDFCSLECFIIVLDESFAEERRKNIESFKISMDLEEE